MAAAAAAADEAEIRAGQDEGMPPSAVDFFMSKVMDRQEDQARDAAQAEAAAQSHTVVEPLEEPEDPEGMSTIKE